MCDDGVAEARKCTETRDEGTTTATTALVELSMPSEARAVRAQGYIQTFQERLAVGALLGFPRPPHRAVADPLAADPPKHLSRADSTAQRQPFSLPVFSNGELIGGHHTTLAGVGGGGGGGQPCMHASRTAVHVRPLVGCRPERQRAAAASTSPCKDRACRRCIPRHTTSPPPDLRQTSAQALVVVHPPGHASIRPVSRPHPPVRPKIDPSALPCSPGRRHPC